MTGISLAQDVFEYPYNNNVTNTQTEYVMKAFSSTHLYLFFPLLLLSYIPIKIQAQECIIQSHGTIDEISCDANQSICTYEIDLCGIIPHAPNPKRILFQVDYDTDGDDVLESTLSYIIDPPGSNDLTQGTHCLSDYNEQFIINVPRGSRIDVLVRGYVGNGGGSDCITYTYVTTATTNVIQSLPVELSVFEGRPGNEEIYLNWQTLSESNSSHFEIERTTDLSKSFEKIGFLDSHQNSSETQNYIFIDDKPEIVNYYRLKMVDLDGTFEFSNIIRVEMNNVDEYDISVYPNPILTSANASIYSYKNTEAHILLHNIYGQVLIDEIIHLKNGINTIDIDLQHHSEGTYYLAVSDGTNRKTILIQKFVN